MICGGTEDRRSIGLAFFHGWGLSPRFWQPLADLLRTVPHTFFDAGYTGSARAPDYRAATHWVAVGHSLGWAYALQNPPAGGWTGTVNLCGFTRFCAQQADEPGHARHVVERMVRALERTPHSVLRDFLIRCELDELMPMHEQALDTTRLHQDLSLLLDIDVSPEVDTIGVPGLALAAHDDAIVPPQLTASTLGQHPGIDLTWYPSGGHALGYMHAAWCAAQIQAFVHRL